MSTSFTIGVVGQTSAPFPVSPGQNITLTPGASGAGYLEYTTDPASLVVNGNATWTQWAYGAVSTTTGAKTDRALVSMYARATATSAGLSVTIEDATPSVSQLGANWASLLSKKQSSVSVGVLAAQQNTCCIIGESISARIGIPQRAALVTDVVGNGTTATFTLASSAVMTGAKLNFIVGQGTVFDGQILTATSVNVNTFTVPSNLVGSPAAVPAWNNQSRLNERGWFTWANAYLKQKMALLNNAAIGSSTVSTMAANLQAQVIAYAPKYCFCLLGINDLGGSSTPAAVLAQCVSIYQTLIANNIQPIAMTVLPLHQSYATFSTVTPKIMQFNWLLKAYCAQNGIILIDTFEALVDPAQSDGRALSGAIQGTAGDFIHPSTYGARLAGKAVFTALNGLLPTVPLLTNSPADNYGANASNLNLFDQAPWTLTGGTATGTGVSGGAATPSGFAVTSSGVTSSTCVVTSGARTVGSDGDAIGNNIILTMTFAEASATFQVQLNDVSSRIVGGATYKFRGVFRISGTSGSNLAKIVFGILTTYNTTQRGYVFASDTDTTASVMPYEDGTFVYESPAFSIPPGTTASAGFGPFIQFVAGGTGTAVVANLGRFTLQRLS